MTTWHKTIRAGLLAVALAVPAGTSAEGIAGTYLAARQASFLGDFEAAAHFYTRALAYDPARPELLERAILAHVSLGELDVAAGLADRLAQEGFASQLGQTAIVARDAKGEAYNNILLAIDEQRALGPLADGLVKAWSQLGQGDMSAALVEFDKVAGIQGLGAFASYHKALALASVGDFESAEDIFAGNAAGGMTSTRRGVMARAEILSQLGKQDDAVALVDRSFGQDLDPGLSQMRAALVAGDTLPFSHIRSARDGIAEVFYSLAGALSAEGNHDLTLVYARISEYLRPDHIDAILLAADMLESMEQHDLAVKVYESVSVDNPAYHAAALGRAGALRAAGKEDEAVAVLEELTKTHGDLPVVWSTLGDILRADEKFPEAIAAYTAAADRITEVTQRNWFLFYARGIANERGGDWPAAEADFRRALDLSPAQPQVMNYLGYSLVQKKLKLDEALSLIERAVAAQPNSGYIVDSLGWVLYRLGRYEEAVDHMERAAELMPIDPIVNDHLGDVYWSVGREREAEFMWKRALSFADWEDASEEADAERIRRKIEVGLDQVLSDEGAPPLRSADASD